MKKSILLAAALATLLLGACGHRMRHEGPGGPGGMYPSIEPTRPMVAVVASGKYRYIRVDQEPLLFAPDQKDVTITWSVPSGSNYRFGKDGIVVDKPGEEIVRCQPVDGGMRYTCLNRNTRPGKYAYTIRLSDGGEPVVSDPTIVNMRGGD